MPALPQVVQLSLEHAQALDAMVYENTMYMSGRWVTIRNRLQNKADEVAKEIYALQQSGKEVTQAWLNEQAYYRALAEQADNAAGQYAGWSANYTQQQIIKAAKFSTDEATLIAGRLYDTTAMGYFKGLPQAQVESIQAITLRDAPLDKLFQSISPNHYDELTNSLMTGLSMGMPMTEIAGLMMNVVDITYKRALLISRTEVNRAHRSATLRTYQEYEVPYYRRLASREHACFACMMLDGTLYSSKEALDDHPNGACQKVPVLDPDSKSTDWEHGKERFEKMSEAEQREIMGNNYFDAWKRGDFTLDQMVVVRQNPVWGGSPGVRPLKELSPNWKSYRQNSGIPQGTQGAYVSGRVFTEADWDTLRKRITDNKEWVSEGYMDYTLKEMYRMTGYDGLPTMLSQSEYDKMVASGQITDLYRTVRGQGGVSGQVYVQDFRTGDYFAGKGLYGNGTYFTPSKSYAESYGGELIQAGLRSDAKVVSYSDLQELMKQNSGLDTYRQALFERGWSEKDVSLLDAFEKMDRINAQEIGKFAVSMGYDAIDLGTIPHTFPEVIVLNRTALFIKR